MFIVYGFRPMKKVLVQTGPYTCNNCHNATMFQVVQERNWFTIFFIPLIPLGRKFYHVCPICQQGYQITKEQAMELKAQAEAAGATQNNFQ